MKIEVNTYNTIEGFHCWPDATGGFEYLSKRHRHIFVIRGSFPVSHGNREIEINHQQNMIEGFLVAKYGRPCEFGSLSCEQIAKELMIKFEMSSCQVLEDGYGGATLTR